MRTGARVKTLILAASLLLFFLAVVLAVLPAVVDDLPPARRALEARIGRAIGGEVAIESLRLHALPRPGLTARGVRGGWPAGGAFEAAEVRLDLRLPELLFGRVKPAAVRVRSPRLALSIAPGGLAPGGGWTAALPQIAGLAAEAAGRLPRMRLELDSGRLDLAAADGRRLRLEAVDLELRRRRQGLHFRLAAASEHGERLTAEGRVGTDSPEGRLALALKDVDPGRLIPWLAPDSGWSLEGGRADISVAAAWSAEGRLEARAEGRAPGLEIRRGARRATLALERFRAEFDASPESLRLSVDEFVARQPAAELALAIGWGRGSGIDLTLRGAGEAGEAREALLALGGGELRELDTVFQILRGGRVPWIEIRSRGSDWEELADLANLVIRGRLERGRLFIPGVALDLEEVSGEADIAGGWLEGRSLAARYRESRGERGALRLGLTAARSVIDLDIQVAADLAPLPAILSRVAASEGFRQGLAQVADFSGEAEGRLRVVGDLHHPEVVVAAERFEVRGRWRPWPLPIALRGGRLGYDGALLQLSGVDATVGRSSLAGLSARLGLGGDLPLAAEARRAECDLGDLKTLLGGLPGLGGVERLEGRVVAADLRLQGKADRPAQWEIGATGSLEGVGIASAALPADLRIGAGGFAWEGRRLRLTGLDPSIGRSAARGVSADIAWEAGGKTKAALGAAALHLQLEEAAGWMAPLFAPEGAADLLPAQLSGALDLEAPRLVLTRDPTTGVGLERFESDRARASIAAPSLGLPLSIDGGPIVFAAGRFEGRATSLALGTSRVESLSAVVDRRGGRPFLQLGAAAAAIDLEALTGLLARLPGSPFARGEITGLTGRLSLANPTLRGPLDAPGQWVWRASGEVRNASALIAGFEAPVEVLEARLGAFESPGADRTMLRVEAARLRWNRTLLDARGEIGLGSEEVAADVAVAAESLDLEAVERVYRRFALGRSESGRRVTGTIRLAAESAHYGRFRSEPLRLEILLGPSERTVLFERMALCGIPVIGALSFSDGAVRGQLVPLAAESSLEQSTACLSGEETRYTGLFNLDGAIDFDGPADRLLEAATGSLTFVAETGSVLRSSFFTRLLSLLSLTEILRGDLPDFRSEGLAYNRMAADLEVRGGKLAIHRWYFDGRTLWMGARGEIDLSRLELDAVVMVSPFKTFDRIVSQIPGLRWVLGGRLVAIPFQVQGELNDPRIIPMHPAAVGTGLAETFMRLLTLPLSIIQPFVPGLDASEALRESRPIIRE